MVLVKKYPTSDSIQGITSKFQRPYEGPYVIHTIINASLVELKDTMGKYKGLFSKKHLKPYHDFEREEKVHSEERSANVSKYMEEVENQKKERTVNHLRIKSIKRKLTQQDIKLQNRENWTYWKV
jgi:hypothetical protein